MELNSRTHCWYLRIACNYVGALPLCCRQTRRKYSELSLYIVLHWLYSRMQSFRNNQAGSDSPKPPYWMSTLGPHDLPRAASVVCHRTVSTAQAF